MKTKFKARIIITFFVIALLLIGISAVAQTDSTAQYWLEIGGTIANTARPQQWINGVDNTILSAIITAVGSLVVGIIKRRKEKNKLRKQGKLND
jgi:ABC-type Fe3+ transport system permease subunit